MFKFAWIAQAVTLSSTPSLLVTGRDPWFPDGYASPFLGNLVAMAGSARHGVGQVGIPFSYGIGPFNLMAEAEATRAIRVVNFIF